MSQRQRTVVVCDVQDEPEEHEGSTYEMTVRRRDPETGEWTAILPPTRLDACSEVYADKIRQGIDVFQLYGTPVDKPASAPKPLTLPQRPRQAKQPKVASPPRKQATVAEPTRQAADAASLPPVVEGNGRGKDGKYYCRLVGCTRKGWAWPTDRNAHERVDHKMWQGKPTSETAWVLDPLDSPKNVDETGEQPQGPVDEKPVSKVTRSQVAAGKKTAQGKDYPSAVVRAWARAHDDELPKGINIPVHGNFLPAPLVEEWRKAVRAWAGEHDVDAPKGKFHGPKGKKVVRQWFDAPDGGKLLGLATDLKY